MGSEENRAKDRESAFPSEGAIIRAGFVGVWRRITRGILSFEETARVITCRRMHLECRFKAREKMRRKESNQSFSRDRHRIISWY